MTIHRIDLSSVKEEACSEFDRNFKRCVGTGRIDLALREDYMENLRTIQSEIGFDMIRGHGLLSDQMGVYREKMDMKKIVVPYSKPLHNFNRMIKVFDNFLSTGINPFVELGFMPSHLASGDATQFWWQGNITPPKDEKLWTDLIQSIVKTLIEYYGLDAVRSWPFEVWNEPDLPQFWFNKDEKAYHRLYAITARAIKEIDENIQVGGPASCPSGGEWTPRFLKMCQEENVPVDFASHHVYVSSPADNREEFVYQSTRDIKACWDKFAEVPGYVKDSAFPHLPVHITEWNTSFSPRNPVHDTAFNAAYVAWVLTHVGELVDSFSYWTFCDVFEEQDIPSALFHGGFGLMTEDGLRKPTYHAFAFANRLSGPILHRDDMSCITRREDGSLSGLFFQPNPNCHQGEGETLTVELNLPFTSNAVVSLKHVNDSQGNAYTTWKTLGRPRWPNGREREILDHAQWPHQETREVNSESGMINISFPLPTNGMVLLEVFERRSESYPGLMENEYHLPE